MPDKKPQDHLEKATPPPSKSKYVTLDGHDYLIDPKRMDDLHFLEAYEDEKWVTVLRIMLGREQWAQFYVNHGDADGRVTGEKFTKIIDDLAEADLNLGN